MKEEIPSRISLKFLPHFPTVLIGSGREDDSNLITVAMIHVFSFDPPMIGIGISNKRHSFKLLEENPEFTVNVPNSSQLDKIIGCGKVSGEDVNKFEEYDLTKENSKNISTPGITEFPLILECKIINKIETGDHHWFVGNVVNAKKSPNYEKEDTLLYWGGEFRKPGELLEQY